MKNPVFALRLAEARARAGISQAELGRRAGLAPEVASPRVNQYEKGKHMPDSSTVRQLAEVLGVPVAYLFAEDEDLAKLILLWSDLSSTEKRELLEKLKNFATERK